MSKMTKYLIELGDIDTNEIDLLVGLIKPDSISEKELLILQKYVNEFLVNTAMIQMAMNGKVFIGFKKGRVTFTAKKD